MAKTIQEEVAKKITTSGTKVFDIVVDKLAEVEINRRVEVITKAVNRLDNLEKDLKKIDGKMDTINYDGTGKKIETMSDKRFQEITKAKKAFDDFKTAFDNALNKNDNESYGKLNGLLNSNKAESSGENKSES